MTKIRSLKAKITAGNPVFGLFAIMPSPISIECIALGGVDFIIIDMEHGIFGPKELDDCVRACQSAGIHAIVRTPGLNLSATQWALDVGACGVLVPQVDGFEQASEAVAITKFSPHGSRGYNPFVRAGNYGDNINSENVLSNDYPLTSILVETRQSLKDLEKICTLPGLDAIFIGAYDLSVLLGFPGDVSHPELQAIITESVKIITKAQKGAFIMVRTTEDMKHALSIGAKCLVGGVDTSVLRDATFKMVKKFQKAQ